MTPDQQKAMALAEAEARAKSLQGAGGGATPQQPTRGPAEQSPPSVPPVPSAGSPTTDAYQGQGFLGRIGNVIGEHLARGMVSTVGAPRSLTEWESQKAHEYLPQSVTHWTDMLLGKPVQPGQPKQFGAPDVGDVNEWMNRQEDKYGIGIGPYRNPGERYLGSAMEGVGSVLAGGPELGAAKVLRAGVGGGLASEYAHEKFPKSDVAPVIAGIVGGGIASHGVEAGEAAARSPAGQLVEQTFSPTTVDEAAGHAEALIRQYEGRGVRDQAITAADVAPFRKQMVSLPDADRLKLTHYMETRSTANAPAIPKEWQKAADGVRDAYQLRATKLSNLPEYEQREFIKDYAVHQWADPRAAKEFYSGFGGKEGSGKNLKARSIPTIAEGLEKGLKLKNTDPVQAMLEYVANMDRFIATKQIMRDAMDDGSVRAIPRGAMAPEGMVKLKTGVAGNADYYAPEGFARVYNNFISRGAHGSDVGGRWYDALQHTNGAINGVQLGLSAWHLKTEMAQAVENQVARGLSQALGGQPLKGAAAILTSPAAPITTFLKGRQAMSEYLRPGTSKSPLMKTIGDLMADANANVTSLTKDLRAGAATDFYTAIKRGTAKMELMSDLRDMQGRPIAGTAKAFFKNVRRTLDTVAYPLFQYYVPRLKAGAFAENMAAWLEANPEASPAAQQKMARTMWDQMDNAFGEMNHDNVFWPKMLKQASQLIMRSPSWTIGTQRMLGGGIKDIAKNPGSLSMRSPDYSPRAAATVVMPLVYASIMAAYQYMKTGKPPEDIRDLEAGRSGGRDPGTNQPQRVQYPSNIKDVFGYLDDPVQEAKNKMSPLLQTMGEMVTGKDWRGDPISTVSKWEDPPEWAKQWLMHIASSYAPISVQQTVQGQKRGSNISTLDSLLGFSPARRSLTESPLQKEYWDRREQNKENHLKSMHDARQKSQYEHGGTKKHEPLDLSVTKYKGIE